ncbi:hypothetical protein OG873_11750 [Streptomyces violaceus]|nr:hypothetical protein [Streptomyces violaceus]
MGNDGSELLDARLLDFSGSDPVIGLSETDTDAAEARAKATELRRFADELEILADKVDAIISREQARDPERVVCPDGMSQVSDEAPGLDFVAGGDWPTLSLGEVDELISDMSVHLAKLRAAPTQIAGLMSGQTIETAATAGRTWTYDDRYGTRHAVTCPSWCTVDHTDDMDGARHPADVHHQMYGTVAHAEYTEGYENYKSWQ